MTVVDYGLGNLLSVRRGFEHGGAEVVVTSDPTEVRRAEHLVLPGVGAFADGMAGLAELGLVEPLVEHARAGKPLLGICLGLHLLMEQSNEFGQHRGLGLLPGRTVALERATTAKVPHIGWSPLEPPAEGDEDAWRGTILHDVPGGADVYFVHSFVVEPADPGDRLAETPFDGTRFPAVIRRAAVSGTQFHPEKSGEIGLRILARFLA